jgi:hypothetical protein
MDVVRAVPTETISEKLSVRRLSEALALDGKAMIDVDANSSWWGSARRRPSPRECGSASPTWGSGRSPSTSWRHLR